MAPRVNSGEFGRTKSAMSVPNCPGAKLFGAKLPQKSKWVYSAIACKKSQNTWSLCCPKQVWSGKYDGYEAFKFESFSFFVPHQIKRQAGPRRVSYESGSITTSCTPTFLCPAFLVTQSPSSRLQIRTKITQEKTSIKSPVDKDCISLRLKFYNISEQNPFQEMHCVEWITPRGDILPVVVSF